MQIKVKVCGLSTREAVDAAVAGGATHLGFVISRHAGVGNVSLEEAAELATRVPRHVRKVGVFFEQDSIFFLAAINLVGLHVLQLHATNPRQAFFERTNLGRSVRGIVTVRTANDLRAATQWEGAADRILYDVKGRDWKLLQRLAHPLPCTLGGDLDQDNVAEAVGITGAKTIDVSSGIESASGIKDPRKIAAFLDTVRTISDKAKRKGS